jgi:anti-sigma factor RsiW
VPSPWWYQESMGEIESQLSPAEMAELTALADGSLPAERRQAVEARVAASPELRELVERQRRAVAATQILASEPVPASLRGTIEGRLRGGEGRRAPRPRFAPRLALGGVAAAAAAVAVTLVAILSGGAATPSVADAARLATRQPTAPAPPPAPHSQTKLAARVDGATFPDFLRSYGWRPVGIRHDRLDGRGATTVFYGQKGRRIAYVIVAGSGLPRPGGKTTVRRGVALKTLTVDGRPAVTWRRLGHTCVLTGATSRAELYRLASWRGGGTLRY